MASLKSRLLISSLLLLLVTLSIIGYRLQQSFIQKSESSIKIFLESQIFDLQRSAHLDNDGHLVLPKLLNNRRLNQQDSGYYAAVAQNKKIIWTSQSSENIDLPFATDLKPGQRVFKSVISADGDELFMFSLGYVWIDEQGVPSLFIFNVAESNNNYLKELSSFQRQLWLWLFVILVFYVVTQTVILRWGLSPLLKLRKDLSDIAQGKREFLDINFIDEIKDLTADFNTLLRNERTRQERYKNSLGDLAHSFKTPLAVIQSVIKNEKVDSKTSRVLQEQVDSLNSQVTYQLRKAQTAGSRASLSKPVLLKPVISKISSALLKVHKNKNIDFIIDVSDDTVFYGDDGDIFEVIGNLLDNAFKWTKSKVVIIATNERLSDGIVLKITVEDDGVGITDDKKQYILQRGKRADEKTPGHGIGMSIITDIISSYSGKLEVLDSEYGGAKFIIQFKH